MVQRVDSQDLPVHVHRAELGLKDFLTAPKQLLRLFQTACLLQKKTNGKGACGSPHHPLGQVWSRRSPDSA